MKCIVECQIEQSMHQQKTNAAMKRSMNTNLACLITKKKCSCLVFQS